MALSEQRLNQLNARAADIEERLRGKETELAQTRTQFQQLTADFRYNLKLLEDRDAELERLDGAVVTHRASAEKAEQALAAARAAASEKDAELRRQKARVGELEAYHAEKVERLRKQTDEARYARDDALQRQKDDFANLERALVRQVEEQKAALETERREAAEETQRARLEQTEAIAVPLNDLRRELSDEKAQTLALAAELEAWRAREENTRGELAKSETARRAAEQNAVAVCEKLAETETTVGALRGRWLSSARSRTWRRRRASGWRRSRGGTRRLRRWRGGTRSSRRASAEADRLRARVATLEEALRVSRRDSSERSVGARRAKGKRVTIREDEMDPSDGGSSASEVSDAESESDATPPPRRRRGGGADATPPSIGTSAPPSIGKEQPEAVAAASAAAAAIAEMEHKTRVRDLARRGDKPDAAASSSQVERVWSALPPRAPAPAHVAVSRAEIEKAAAAAVEAALASRMHAPRALEADAAAGARRRTPAPAPTPTPTRPRRARNWPTRSARLRFPAPPR